MLFDLFESQEIQNNVSENTRYYISIVGNVSGDVSLRNILVIVREESEGVPKVLCFIFHNLPVLFPFSVLIFCLVCYVSLQGARE